MVAAQCRTCAARVPQVCGFSSAALRSGSVPQILILSGARILAEAESVQPHHETRLKMPEERQLK